MTPQLLWVRRPWLLHTCFGSRRPSTTTIS